MGKVQKTSRMWVSFHFHIEKFLPWVKKLLTCAYLCKNHHFTVNCPELSQPEGGTVSVTGNYQGAIATYTCNRGYMLVGMATRTCLSTEVWNSTEPTCEVPGTVVIVDVKSLGMRKPTLWVSNLV